MNLVHSQHKTNPDDIRFTVIGKAVVMQEIVEESEVGTTPRTKRSKVASTYKKGIGPSSLEPLIDQAVCVPIDLFKLGICKNIGSGYDADHAG